MNNRKSPWLALLASLVLAPICWAQAPAVPAAPGAVPAAPAAPGNLWSFLLPNAEQKANCKTCFCNSPLGQLTTGAAGPMASMSGGLIANRCEQNSIANGMKLPPDNPEGLAARVKKDEADAKARRAAVRFLSTVDCNYWPEAIDTFILALRKDRNECVRFEAAIALQNGCCCNAIIVEALKNSVLGMNKTDQFPPERSDRVRAAATDALARCVLPIPEEKKSEENLQKTELKPNPDTTDYYKKIALMPREKVVASARAVLVSMQKANASATGGATPAPASGTPAEPGSVPAPSVGGVPTIAPRGATVSGIVAHAFSPGSTTTGPQSRQPFFSSLTKTLTGKQDTVIVGRQEFVVTGRQEVAPPPLRSDVNLPALSTPLSESRPQDLRPQGVPQESRPQSVPQETRPQSVPQETRPQSVPQETRPQSVPQELRGVVTEDN